MPSLVKCKGLHTNHNELALPEGALRKADNIVIDQNDVASPRRGLGSYGDELPLSTDRPNQLLIYKDRILRHYNSILQFDSDGSGTFSDFSGTYDELVDGLRIKYIEQNGNLYFTTDEGIKKISATSASQFSTAVNYIKDAGLPKGLDLQADLNAAVAGFFTVDNQVAYRVIWGYTDANSNLLLGSPSERTVIINPAAGSTSNVEITFTIPEASNTIDYFYQIYRTGLSGGEDIDPGDEMNLVYEENLTTTDIANGYVNLQYEDYPDSFREASNLLYSNEISGDGILQANDKPPVAKDIASFKESIFYANTKTLHRKVLTLLGTSGFVAGTSKFVIGSEDVYVEYTAETAEDLDAREFKVFTAGSVAQNIYDTAKSLVKVINRDTNCRANVTVVDYSNLSSDTLTINDVVLTEGSDWTAATDNDTTAESIKDAINNDATLGPLVTASRTGAVVKVQANNAGLDFAYLMSTSDTTNLTVPSRLICSPLVAYYTSGAEDLPGQLTFEAKTLSDEYIDFGVVGSIGNLFNPTLPETISVVSITNATSPVITTSSAHGWTTGDTVYLNSEDTDPIINNSYEITVLSPTTYSITETITTGSSSGTTFKSTVYTDNEDAPNRLYFSKTSQPEAVPLLNWIDVGDKDSEIKRILALRDNLFVLKENSVYVVSGTSAPNFSVRLLDNSVTIKAADTATVLNNQIFALTNQGVANISDAGVGIISRVIEDLILGVTNSRFTSFETQAFGIGYESERSYLLWLPEKTNDTYATQCFRYNTFNQTWTRWTKTCTCGVVNAGGDDKLYLGDGENNFILQERKNDARSDYSDLEYSTTIASNGVDGNNVQLSSIANVSIGDVIYQEQYVTISRFDVLLKKLDIDVGLDDTDYYSSLSMSQGDSPYTAVENLITKLNTDDSGQTYVWDSPSTFTELQTTYNNMVTKLNEAASDSFFTNYRSITTSVGYESVVLDRNVAPNSLDLALSIPFIEGPVTIYKGYEKLIEWAPQHFGDESIWKQVREGTIFFDGNTFTNASYGFATDFSPSFENSSFDGLGIGSFGFSSFGSTVFGGEGTDKPIRLLVPRQKMRCRHIATQFKHINAREAFKIVGMSYTLRPFSSRGYRSV